MFFCLLEQIVYNFKGEIFNIFDFFFILFFQWVFGGFFELINGIDDEIQFQELRWEYVFFVQVIFMNDFGGVLVFVVNQGNFEFFVLFIFSVVKNFNYGNFVVSWIVFNVFSCMIMQWGGFDIIILGENLVVIGFFFFIIFGFEQFMFFQFYGVCWDVLQDGGF